MNNEDNKFPEVEIAENMTEVEMPEVNEAEEMTTEESNYGDTAESTTTESVATMSTEKGKKSSAKKTSKGLGKEKLLGMLKWKGKNFKLPVMSSLMKKFEEQENETDEISLPQKGFLRHFSGIRTKLLMGFALPVVLMAVFGTISYNRTSQAIVENYELIASDALNAVRDYIFLGVDAVSNKSYELTDNIAMKDYYNNADTMSVQESTAALELVKNELMNAKASHSFIYSMHMIGEQGSGVSSVDELPADTYSGFIESQEGKTITSALERYVWVGNHSFLDEKLSNKQVNYSISIIRKMAENNGFIIIDVPKTEIARAVSNIKLGEGSIVGFVTNDGYETLANSEEASVFSSLEYYKEALADNKFNGVSYEKYNGKDYMFLYSKVGSTKAMVCALVPESTILAKAQSIKMLTVLAIIVASVLALFVGTLIAASIGAEISKLSKNIAVAAKGNLTTKFRTRRKDEFLILSNSLNDMVDGMRGLIEQVATVGNEVNSSADSLSATSSDILTSTKDISLAIDEIEKGVVQQASDTEQCLLQMSNLSDKINQVYNNTYEIEQIAKEAKVIVGEGITTIEELNDKSNATTEITRVVINEIEDLELQSASIESFIEVINSIADQTNLLSLNASIEAARAGEAGRGFAVVAAEIRKLAEQSVKASSQITTVVHTIKEKTKVTAHTAKKAENIVASQMESLTKTVKNFENINEQVGNLVNNLNNIAEGIRGIENAKDDTLDAISNISAVSQQTATSSEEVSATAINQITSVEYLSQSADVLAQQAKQLEEAIKIFQITEE
ncbi:MAG: methyl-accepting chemotaxis sensory transducer [Herbinix sp.]|nr:methyl-accepting chemotaxis sensory transducer [Herbinix sp.]